MTGIVINLPYVTVLDSNGDPAVAAEIYVYDAGTTTPRDTFSDAGLTVPQSHPVLTDGAGEAGPMYINPDDGPYKIRVVHGQVDESYDNLAPGVTVPVSVAQGGTGATNPPDARTNLSVPSQTDFDALDTQVSQLASDLATPYPWPATDIPFATTVTPNFGSSHFNQVVNITANMYVNPPDGVEPGIYGRLILINDNIGGKLITFDPLWNFPSGNPDLSQEPNAINVVAFYILDDNSIVSEIIRYGSSEKFAGPDVYAEEHQPTGTPAGNTTSGQWRNRDLTRLRTNRGSIATITNGNLVLDPGNYYGEGSFTFNNAQTYGQHRFINADNADEVLLQSTIWGGGSNNQGTTHMAGPFSVASQSTLSVQYRTDGSSTNGLGAPADFGIDEIYGQLKIWAL